MAGPDQDRTCLTLLKSTSMFRHHLLIAWRNLLRQRVFSLINLLGLSVGLTCTFLIVLWVQDEMRMDRFHAKGDRLYRLIAHLDFGGQVTSWTNVPLALGREVAPEVPEVADMTFLSLKLPKLFTYQGESVQREGLYVSDNFFSHLSFPLLHGQAGQVLTQPHSAVISERLARQLFGPKHLAQAIGQTVELDQEESYQITGVMQTLPRHSTWQFDYVLPMQDLVEQAPYQLEWGNFNFSGYALLTEGADPAKVRQTIEQVVKDKSGRDMADFELQPISEQYLYGNFEAGRNTGGRITYVRVFSAAALFLLLIACINFMNLATARASKRAREVGVRKAIGASRRTLVAQFYGEALLMAGLALLLAVISTEALLPAFNELTGKALVSPLGHPHHWLILLGIALLAGLLAGSYPALMLSSFPILSVLRGGNFSLGRGNLNLRRGLVVFQFALSILLIASTLVVYQQVQYIQNKQLGMDKSQVLRFKLPDFSPTRMQRLRNALAQEPAVQHLTATDQTPMAMSNSTTSVGWSGKAEGEEPVFHAMRVDYDFTETFRIPLLAGRDFARSFAGDTAAYLINEQSMRTAGFASPEAAIGQDWELWGQPGKIVGVVQDYHIASFYTPIEPLILKLETAWTGQVYARLAPQQLEAGVAAVEAAFHALAPDYPFDYTFADQQFAQLYASEQVMSQLAWLAAVLGIFVACLGLLGLAAFSAEQRTRELSIRKVLGASVAQLLVLMGREFTLLVGLAFVLAAPLAAWLLSDWLSGFAYRIDLSAGIFALSGAAALLIAWLIIVWQSWRAAHTNPAEALRAE